MRDFFEPDISKYFFHSFGRDHTTLSSPGHTSSSESTVTSSGEWTRKRYHHRVLVLQLWAWCPVTCWHVCKWEEHRQILLHSIRALSFFLLIDSGSETLNKGSGYLACKLLCEKKKDRSDSMIKVKGKLLKGSSMVSNLKH